MRIASLIIGILMACHAQADMQTWVDTKGRKLVAEVVSATATQVTMKLENGKERTFPLRIFSAASQEQIAARDGAQPAAAAAAEAATDDPREARRNRRKGSRRIGGAAVKSWDLTGASFSLGSNGSATFVFKPKAGEQPLPPAIFEPNLLYKADGRSRQKKFEKVVGEPVIKGNSVMVTLQFTQDSQVQVNYEIGEASVTAWYAVQEARNISFPTVNHNLAIRMPTMVEWDLSVEGFHSPRFDTPMTQGQLEKHFAEKVLKAKAVGGKTDTYPFAQKVDKGTFRGARSEISVTRDTYNANAVLFAAPQEKAQMHLLFYNGKTPLDGFGVVLQNDKLGMSSRRSAITLSLQ